MNSQVNTAVERILGRLSKLEDKVNRGVATETPIYWDGTNVAVGRLVNDAKFQVYDSTPLPAVTNSFRHIASIGGSTTNHVALKVTLYRTSNALGWANAELILQRWTDVTGQAYLSFNGSNIGVNTIASGFTLAIGDSDTGFHWVQDGLMRAYANNVPVFSWNGTTMEIHKNLIIGPFGTLGDAAYKLYIVGNTSLAGDYAAVIRNYAGANLMYLENNGTSFVNQAWTLSDKRGKRNIKPLSHGLATIRKLKTYSYNIAENGMPDLGFMADEVADPNGANIPELTRFASHCIHCNRFQAEHTGEEDHTFDPVLSMNREAIIPIIVNALQELAEQVDAMKTPRLSPKE